MTVIIEPIVFAAVVYFLAGLFTTIRFLQYAGMPSIVEREDERPKSLFLIRIWLALIVMLMFLFWPCLWAVFFGYLNE